MIDTEDAPSNRFEDEENQYIADYFAEQEQEEPLDEDAKAEQTPPLRRKWLTDKVCSDEFRKAVTSDTHDAIESNLNSDVAEGYVESVSTTFKSIIGAVGMIDEPEEDSITSLSDP